MGMLALQVLLPETLFSCFVQLNSCVVATHSRQCILDPAAVAAAAAAGLADVEVAEVEDAVARFENITGRRPRILIAKMGQDGHDRWAADHSVVAARSGALHQPSPMIQQGDHDQA